MLQKIDENLYLISNRAGFTYGNCLLIEDRVRAVIDSGAGLDSLAAARPHEVDLLLNSHHHYDHIRGNHLFTRADKRIHALDYNALRNEEEYNFYNSFDRWEELMPGYEMSAARDQMKLDERLAIEDLRAAGSFEDGEEFNLGGTLCQVVHTPGHSAGHCAFWFPKLDFMFTGDICLTATGPWYGEICASPDDFIASINRIIEFKPGRIATGHSRGLVEDPLPHLLEYQERISRREERIYGYLKTAEADIHQLADQHFIYRLHPSWYVLFWEKLMLDKHLDRLELQGRVERSEQGLFRAL